MAAAPSVGRTAGQLAAAPLELPRAVPLVILLVLVAGLNRYWPELLPAIGVLLVLYLVTSNTTRAAQLVGWLPDRLASGFTATTGAVVGTRGRLAS